MFLLGSCTFTNSLPDHRLEEPSSPPLSLHNSLRILHKLHNYKSTISLIPLANKKPASTHHLHNSIASILSYRTQYIKYPWIRYRRQVPCGTAFHWKKLLDSSSSSHSSTGPTCFSKYVKDTSQVHRPLTLETGRRRMQPTRPKKNKRGYGGKKWRCSIWGWSLTLGATS